MPHHPKQVDRRRFLQLLGLSGALAALPSVVGVNSAQALGSSARLAGSASPPDETAATYHRVLLQHTHWSETQWDEARGYYTDKDFGFAVVLGHAVLLTHGTYDSGPAGIDRDTLKARTLATHPALRGVQPAHGRDPVGPQAVLRHHVPVVLRPCRAVALGRPRQRDAHERRHHRS